jgi:hypothetical protein
MARNGVKTGGRDFKKGVSPNPKGATPVPEEVRVARKLNKVEFERIANTYFSMTKEQLHKAKEFKETKVLDLIVISIMLKAITTGDHYRLNFLMDRLIGKVPQPISDPDGKPLEIKTYHDLILIFRGKLEERHEREVEQLESRNTGTGSTTA